jgi:hypothetical protein
MDQMDPVKPAVIAAELLQGRNGVIGILGLQADCFHLPSTIDQEIQDVDHAMPDVVELLLLDPVGDAAADRHPL